MNYKTLTEAFLALNSIDRGIYHIEGEDKENFISYDELKSRAKGLLGYFQHKGIKQGSQLIISVLKNEQFIDSFWASVLGGVIPVPVAFGISDEHRAKIFRIFNKLEDPYLFVESANLKRLGAFAEKNGLEKEFSLLSEKAIILDEIENLDHEGKIVDVQPDDTAFIQFSSGSTSDPKGVVLTHENVTTNVLDILAGIEVTDNDSTVSWMPLTHDMGLIGFHLCELVQGINQTLMPTELFVRRPLLWMKLASEKKVTVTCSPNFGYKHYLKAFDGSKDHGLDLSSIRVIFNGAEPISIDLCNSFLDALKPYGLDNKAMFPVYGLAEASLAVTFPKAGTGVRTLRLDKSLLGLGQAVEIASEDSANTLNYVIEGKPLKNTEVRITDENRNEYDNGIVGQVEIRGKNVTRGYYKADEINEEFINKDGWVNTGDLGFIHKEELVITGRNKDIIFINGQNYYPHDLENIIVNTTDIDLGKVAFTGIRPADADHDDVISFVIHKGKLENFLPLLKIIKTQINKDFAFEIDRVIPVDKIPKTTSGKIQRFILAEQYLEGQFNETIKEIETLAEAEKSSGGASGNIEAEILKIASEFITEQDISSDDDIFEIGMSSLTLAQIHEKIEEKYPGMLDITDFFDYPTIRELSTFMEKKIEDQE